MPLTFLRPLCLHGGNATQWGCRCASLPSSEFRAVTFVARDGSRGSIHTRKLGLPPWPALQSWAPAVTCLPAYPWEQESKMSSRFLGSRKWKNGVSTYQVQEKCRKRSCGGGNQLFSLCILGLMWQLCIWLKLLNRPLDVQCTSLRFRENPGWRYRFGSPQHLHNV